MGLFGMDGFQTAMVIIGLLAVVLLITVAAIGAYERVQIAKHTGRDPRVRQNENQ